MTMEGTFHTEGRIPKGIRISESGKSGPEVEKCTYATRPDNSDPSWCYLFIHHNKVAYFTEKLIRDNIRHFIHKTVIYQRRKDTRGIQTIEKPSVSGLVFLQGTPAPLQAYLDNTFPGCHLVNNCSTRRPAVIPHSIMKPFMHVLETSPERIRFLLRPFKYYAGGNVKLRLTSGDFAGLEGYVVRIDRDRRLIMDIGGMSVAISGVHCETFEVVED